MNRCLLLAQLSPLQHVRDIGMILCQCQKIIRIQAIGTGIPDIEYIRGCFTFQDANQRGTHPLLFHITGGLCKNQIICFLYGILQPVLDLYITAAFLHF